MDWEAPVDAWYVWLGASIVSLAIAGVVLALPTGPPPDAEGATNAIEETTASSYEAASTLDHNADTIRIDGKTVALRNEHGTSRSSLRYGQVVVVNGDERLERLVHGESFETVFESELEDEGTNAAAAFMDRVADADENNSGEWLTASDELTVRQVAVEPDERAKLHASGVDHDRSVKAGLYYRPEQLSIDPRDVDEGTTVTYTVTGEVPVEATDRVPAVYSTGGYEAERTVTHGDSGTVRIDLGSHITDGSELNRSRFSDIDGSSEDFWAGVYPLTVTAELDSQTCETTLLNRFDSGYICSPVTATDERAAELDWVERNDETEQYHVTLVVV
ncbi:hypothetical protein [Haloterrigena salinisoli]|uniref:DUF7283 family protein n=1 Tax=Haloterrigena salinisoli TaxID=3132747 RepID=UPI0030CDD895